MGTKKEKAGKVNQVIWMAPLVILSLFGVIFLGLLIHEATHVAQSKEPISICYDFQQATMAHVWHDTTAWALENNHTRAATLAEFHDWQIYTEKWAYNIQGFLLAILPFLLGISTTMCWRKYNERKRKED